VYDPQKEDTGRANLDTEEGVKGNYSPDIHAIQIAGKSGTYEQVRGTVIHEFCHMACDLVWQNERNPYCSDAPEAKRFTEICVTIKEEYDDTRTRKALDPLVQGVFNSRYDEKKYARELIVRVPQIIASVGMQHIEILCRESPGFHQLFNYYREVVLPRFSEFVAKSNPSQRPLLRQEEMEWDSFVLRKKGTRYQNNVDAAIKIQAIWRGTITRQTYQRIQFLEAYINRLNALFDNLGALESKKVIEGELRPQALKIKDDFCSSTRGLLFAFRNSETMVSKVKLANRDVSVLVNKFNI